MIELTVKTLDSQNHAFSVEDDITVAQFKVKIADTVNIPADTQRIIYCGRVLQDDAKLNDYDVNGKVVHLVQRAPPSVQNQSSSRAASPQAQRTRGYRGMEHGNAMYLGSMAFPSNLMESQGILPPLPTRSLAPSRLNVARRMLKRAEAVIRALENPQSRPNEQTPPEEPQEEVTPVFEAHVIVPTNSEAIDVDEALVLSAVQDSVLDAAAAVPTTEETVIDTAVPESSTSVGTSESAAEPDNFIDNDSPTISTPEEREPETSAGAAAAAETSQTGEQSSTSNAAAPENISRTSEMAELLTLLGQLQVRFAPFLERYQNFMQEDPTVAEDEVRQTQNMVNRVSEVLHFLGHAYHSLSDIILKVRTPLPRALLCRPILIQHSALLQTGFPIQVEAQINFSSDRPNNNAPPPPPRQPTDASAPTDPNAAPPSNASNASDAPNPATTQPNGTQQHFFPTPQMFGIPLMPPRASMLVESFPIEIRGIRRRNRNNNNVTTTVGQTQTTATDAASSSSSLPSTATSAENATTGQTASATSVPESQSAGQQGGLQNQWPNFNNPNMEFFMEVTPESITIDSVETTHFGENQANDVLHGAMNQAPPEILQSIFQMAGQIINPSQPPPQPNPPTSSEPTAPPSETTSSAASTPNSVNSTQPGATGQNSQARGNTQTNPTTATHTRSTSRPHVVHLAQHAMQGFDPFLPCNSHHVTSRRRIHMQNAQPANTGATSRAPREETPSTPPNTANAAPAPPPPPPNPLQNIVQAVMNSFRNAYYAQRFPGAGPNAPNGNAQQQQQQQQQRTTTTGTNTRPPTQEGDGAARVPPFPNFLSHLQNMNLSDLNRQGPTIAELLEQLMPGETQEEGQSVFTDLSIFMTRNLTIEDIANINNGRLEPLMRVRNEIRNFFIRRVLDGCTNSASVDRGVNRLIAELQPFFENNLVYLEVRDDIDIVRSAQMLFRARLPNIINLAISRSPNSLRMLVDQCRITVRQFCALIIHASATGQSAVEQMFNIMLSQHLLEDQLRDMLPWTTGGIRAQLQNFISNLSVPESILQPYIVRRADAVLPSVVDAVDNNVSGDKNNEEAMEVNLDSASGSGTETLSPINLENDPEPLPSVVVGSEPWHNQVPADWVPIITRDSQRQRRQNPQPPFSDAYLSGMPSKRRKIVASSKPQGSLPQVITESVRRAVTATGLTSIAPLETVAQGAGNDLNIQSAYRDLLRTTVPSALQNNEDFTPDRFPNATNYFNKQ